MKKLNILILALFLSLFTIAQNNEKKIATDNSVNNSSYIFIGELISSKSYYAKHKAIYTSNLVSIRSVLKGNLTATTIEILTDGGEMDGLSIKVHDSRDVIPSRLAVYFCNNADSIASPISYNNKNNKGVRIQDVVGFENTTIKKLLGISNYFNTTTELFEYLEKEYSLKTSYLIPEKKSPKLGVNDESSNESSKVNLNYAQNVINYNKAMQDAKIKLELIQNNNKTSIPNSTISVAFANIQETGTLPKFLEFDIMISANNNLTYYDNVLYRIKYNVAAFGQNILTNNKITITATAPFNTSTYLNPQTNSADVATNIVAIPFGTPTSGALNRVLVTTTPQPVLHIKMEIAYCNNFAGIDFSDKATASLNSFHANTANATWANSFPYDTTYYGTGMNQNLCGVNITDFTQPIRAGVGDILTITGSNFGSTRGTGKVKFYNAEGGPLIDGLNTIDYVSWSNTQIQIRVPCTVDSLIGKNAPGSGNFQVINNSGGAGTSGVNLNNQPFNIYYSILNDHRNINGIFKKYKVNLKDDNQLGGYTIRLDQNDFPVGSLQRGCIIKAVELWRCYSKANIIIGADTTLNFFPNTSDGVNYVFMRSTGWLLGEQGRTSNAMNICNTNTSTFSIDQEFDVFFNSNTNWQYDTTFASINPGQLDFLAVALHELGHALQLSHTSNTATDLMFWTGTTGPFGSRKYLYLGQSPTDGALFSVQSSVTSIPTNTCNILPMVQLNIANCGINGINEISKNVMDFNVYPNPVENNKLNISYVLTDKADINFKLITVTGQEIQNFKPNNNNLGEHKEILKLDNLTSGIYFLISEFNGSSKATKILIN